MASIADTLVQSALTQATGDQASKGVESMAQLGEHIQNVQLTRQKVEAQKQQLQDKKLESFVNAIEKGKGFSGQAKSNYYKNFLPKYRDSLGLSDLFPDDALDFALQADPDLRYFGAFKSATRSGKLSGIEAISGWTNPLTMKSIAPELPERVGNSVMTEDQIKEILSAESDYLKDQAQMGRVQAQIQGRKEAATKEFERAPIVDQAKKANTLYTDFIAEGGTASMSTNFDSLSDAMNDLKTGRVKLGDMGSSVASATEWTQDIFDKETAAFRDKVNSAVVGTLRPLLGGAFAEKEGKRIMDLAANPRLSNEENMRRLRLEIRKIQNSVGVKLKFLVDSGKIAPEEIPAEFRLNPNKEAAATKQQIPQAQNQIILQNIKQKLQQNPNLTDEELVQALSARMNRQTAIQLVKQARGGK